MGLDEVVQSEENSNSYKGTQNEKKINLKEKRWYYNYSLIEDKIDFQVITFIKVFGVFTSTVYSILEIYEGSVGFGLFCLLLGLSITFLWMSIFEGFSSVIKLLRKISDK